MVNPGPLTPELFPVNPGTQRFSLRFFYGTVFVFTFTLRTKVKRKILGTVGLVPLVTFVRFSSFFNYVKSFLTRI